MARTVVPAVGTPRPSRLPEHISSVHQRARAAEEALSSFVQLLDDPAVRPSRCLNFVSLPAMPTGLGQLGAIDTAPLARADPFVTGLSVMMSGSTAARDADGLGLPGSPGLLLPVGRRTAASAPSSRTSSTAALLAPPANTQRDDLGGDSFVTEPSFDDEWVLVDDIFGNLDDGMNPSADGSPNILAELSPPPMARGLRDDAIV